MRNPLLRYLAHAARSIGISLSACLFFATFALGQTQITTGAIQGTILDANGAAVPGANVEVKNLDTNLARTTTSDEDGRFVVLQLPSGKTMFTSNQSTLDMRSPERNVSMSSQLILSFDDIAFNTNQSDCNGMFTFANKQIVSDVTLLNTVLLGASVRSNDNRFTEGITMALYSLLSVGFLMATATGNHSSHCLIVGAPRRIEKDNLVLNDDLCRAGRKIFPNIVKHQ